MGSTLTRDVDVLDIGLDVLLSRVPLPLIYATDANGLIVPMPATVPISNPHNVISGHATILELLEPADTHAVYSAWYETLKIGAGQTVVHLINQSSSETVLQLVDARHRFGVFLGFITGQELPLSGAVAETALFRTRLCFIERDTLAVVLRVDDALQEVLGYDAAELIGRKTIDIIHPDDRAAAVTNWMMMLARPGSHARTIVRYRHRDGTWHWFESTITNRLDDPIDPRVSTELVDITDRMATQEALRVSEQLHRHLTESIPLGILQIDVERNIVYRNSRFPIIVGCADAATFDEQLANVVPHERSTLDQAVTAILTTGNVSDSELSIERADGQRVRCNIGMRALTAENGAINGAIIWVADITDPVRLREELEVRATYDALTQCRNRVSILASLESVLRGEQSTNAGTALLFIDLNHFKKVNDTFGHDAGDELLRYTGARLLKTARTGDFIGRLGGDEFLVVSSNVASGDAALALAHRFNVALQKPVILGSHKLAPSAAIGVAWTNRSIAADVLVTQADAAMYRSKRAQLGPVLSSVEGA